MAVVMTRFTVASLIVRFIRPAWPLVHGWVGFVQTVLDAVCSADHAEPHLP